MNGEDDKVADGDSRSGSRIPEDRFVYLMPETLVPKSSTDEVDLREVWNVVWSGKWRIIAVTAVFAIVSVAYALLATEWYRSEVLLAPAEEKSAPALGGQLGGLAALAGVNIGGSDSVEAIATLESRELAREFIESNSLVYTFFAEEWDAENERWIANDPDDQPDIRDAVRYFHDNVLSVSVDRNTNLVTLAIEWKDPVLAAAWATSFADLVNERLRERALREAEINVAYLREELSQTNVVTLQQAIGRLLENELQKLMLARGGEDFAFKVIDPAQTPKERSKPNRKLIAVLGTIAGGMIGLIWIVLSYWMRPSGAGA